MGLFSLDSLLLPVKQQILSFKVLSLFYVDIFLPAIPFAIFLA